METCPFLNGKKEKWLWERGEVWQGLRNCGWDVTYERRINRKEKTHKKFYLS